MTNKERDEILISLVKGLNSLQNTVNEMRTEMKNMVTKEEFDAIKESSHFPKNSWFFLIYVV